MLKRLTALFLLLALFNLSYGDQCAVTLYTRRPDGQTPGVQITFDTAPNGDGFYYDGPFSDGSNTIPWVRYFVAEGGDCTYCSLEAIHADADYAMPLLTHVEVHYYPEALCFKEFRIICDTNAGPIP